MAESPEPLAGDTILAANASDLDVDLIRREWAAVAYGEEERTAWLDAALEAVRRT